MQGCLKSEKVVQENTHIASEVAYIPLVESTDDKGTMIALYKTKGAPETTIKLYEIKSNVTNKEDYIDIFNNFMVLGSYIYYDFVDLNGTQHYAQTYQIRTDSITEKTDEPIYIRPGGRNSNLRTKRVIINDAFYIKKKYTTGPQGYYLEKYNKDGSSIHIEYDGTDTNDSLTYVDMISFDHTLYMTSIQGLVALDAQDDSLSFVDLGMGHLDIRALVGIEDTLYMVIQNSVEQKTQLWAYSITTKDISLVFTFDEKWDYHTRLAQTYVNDSKIFFRYNVAIDAAKQPGLGWGRLDCVDVSTGEIVHLSRLNSQKYLHRIRSHNEDIYYSLQDENNSRVLWKSDGSKAGTKKVLDETNSTIQSKNLTVIDDKIYFSNRTDRHGEELWIIDEKGPRLFLDIASGPVGSSPKYMTKLNDGIIFQATEDSETNHLYYYHHGGLDLIK